MFFKYGLLVIPDLNNFPNINKSTKILPNLYVEYRGDFLKNLAADPWREWLGTIQWEYNLKPAELAFINKSRTTRPDVNDHENKALKEDLEYVTTALMLLGPCPGISGNTHIFTGTAELKNGVLVPKTAVEHSSYPPWIRPAYSFSSSYWKWAYKALSQKNKISEIGKLITELKAVTNMKKNLLLQLALMSFREALRDQLLDFKIPNCVRAIETLIAIPKTGVIKKHYGASATSPEVFANRCIRYFPNIRSLPFNLNRNAQRYL